MESQKGYVYVIFNKVNFKVLIGETGREGNTRLIEHIGDLKKEIERNKPLQKDFNTHGYDAFEFEVIMTSVDYKLLEVLFIG